MTASALPPILWSGSVFEATGYAEEVRGLAMAADAAGIPVRMHNGMEEVEGVREALPSRERHAIERLLGRPLAGECVHVQHHVLDAFAAFSSRALYRIGRTMFETDALPSHWVASANRCDELWVPSTFNRDTFRRAGVEVPITVIPGGIDTGHYTPAAPAMALPGVRSTVFLSVFEWRSRKGWDVLLRAWAEAFSPDDDVTLLLRTYPVGRHDRVAGLAGIAAEMEAFLRDQCGGRTLADVAPIQLVPQRIPSSLMPAFYRAATAFVLPTRGEGWGRPFMEAMACGVPALATRWSAHLDFMNDDNSYLVDVADLVPTQPSDGLVYLGQRWAEPSATHLAEQLRRVYQDRGEATARGARARADIVAHWRWERAGDAMRHRLEELFGRDGGRARSISQGARPASPAGGAWRVVVDGGHGRRDIPTSEPQGWLTALAAPTARTPDGRPVALSWITDTPGDRPPAGSMLETVWRARGAEVGDPELHLTLLDRHRAHAPPTLPAPGVPWVVALGGGSDPMLPEGWAEPLRQRATRVLVAHAGERFACLAAGIEDARITVLPPVLDPRRWEPTTGAYRHPPPVADVRVLLLPASHTLARAQQVVALFDRLVQATDNLVLHLVLPPRWEAGRGAIEMAYAAWRDRVRATWPHRNPRLPAMWLDHFRLDAHEMPCLFRSADVLLHLGVGSGRSILEAQASALPVIALDGAVSRGLVDDRTGWLIPLAKDGRLDAAAFQHALREVQDPVIRRERGAAAAARSRSALGPTEGCQEVWERRVADLWRWAQEGAAIGVAA